MIEARQLYAKGIGLTDAHLVASCLIAPGTMIWTSDSSAARRRAKHVGINADAVPIRTPARIHSDHPSYRCYSERKCVLMPHNLKIVYSVEPDAAALARRAAEFFVVEAERAVAARGQARIAISGGSTPKAAFAALGERGEAVARADAVGQARSVVGR